MKRVAAFLVASVIPLLAGAAACGPPGPSDSPDAAVQRFYRYVIAHRPLGIPQGADKEAIWPLLSPRLRSLLDAAKSCEDDYYRQFRLLPDAENLKPGFPSLELGLFSGSDEEALPAEIRIVSRDPPVIGRHRVLVEFTYRDSFETYGHTPTEEELKRDTFRWRGEVFVVANAGRYLIDEFRGLDRETGKPRWALTTTFVACRGTKWVGPLW